MNLTSVKTIKELLSRHGFSFSKSLGQNFLINPSICPRIVADAVLGGGESSAAMRFGFEIGAGIGVLTKELAKTCEKVVVVEIDQTLKPVLEETLAEFSNVEIIWGDVLKLDLKRLFAERFNGQGEIICCANLPYYITSPVIMRLLEERLPLKSITVMVQKEAALRLCAPPGTRDCGAVSAAVRYYSQPKKLFDVSRGSFMPSPNVDSAVITLKCHEKTREDIADEKLFFRIIRTAFSQRRKQLVNPVSENLKLSKESVRNALGACGINKTARAEELTLEEFAEFYKIIKELLP
ncbi:MAG: 16S rRNA (adenine(1518)-N(6)/adenine(1519)-N(6))-dimethyltransferase RsmA [Oscillospiraceae bacterium]|nr:16S rRNA (adenine(1518)-N(6)/adenine(1519)-N(6))-dimethyltransferase RsmA [Oscillospiraceae bacterium]